VKINEDQWELLKYTADGSLANCNAGDPFKGIAFIAIQRRKSNNRVDHISEVLDPSYYIPSCYFS
jgi:hypothetical protein